MKRKITSITLTAALSLALGYIFLLSWLVGLLASRYIAGDEPGESGRFRSFIIPFRRWRFHLHHWLYSSLLLALSLVSGLHFFSPTVTYGVLGGVMFQGVYYYDDWHVVILQRERKKKSEKPEGKK